MEIGYAAGPTPQTLYDKVWNHHMVGGGDGSDTNLIYIDRHLVHEVTSPQAFDGLRTAKRFVRRTDLTLSTVDHNVPTTDRSSYKDAETFIKEQDSRAQVMALEQNVKEFGVRYWGMDDERQGIVHVIGPEQGFTLPGTTVVCGDSHTSTHGAFGAFAIGIGTSEVEHTLATQTLVLKKLKNLRVQVDGELHKNCASKDVVLHIMGAIGAGGGTGSVIEFCGTAIEKMSMEARMSICNMSIEAGARAGMIAPDDITFAYLKGRPMAPGGAVWDQAVAFWKTLASDKGARFDRTVFLKAEDILPTITWGTSPEDTVPIDGVVPNPEDQADPHKKAAMIRSLEYMGLTPGTKMTDIKVDKAFIGSCTNSRIEDIRAVAAVAKGRKVAAHVVAMVVPGSGNVRKQAEAEGLHLVLKEAGFEWREPGCSMCLGMNPDKLTPQQRCASTSNRNFEGRQGPKGRTHLMSPAMAAAAAVTGRFADVRELMGGATITTGVTTRAAFPDTALPTVTPTITFAAGAGAEGGMGKFSTLTAVAAPMEAPNIDTDKIIPARFLKTIKRTGLGASVFCDMRFNADGSEKPEFVLNKAQYRGANILVCGDNFGCGSSREHAPWALKDWGIKCLIATSFADIFQSNCYKNGLVPIVLDQRDVDKVMDDASKVVQVTVDLARQVVIRANKEELKFEIDAFKKDCLINGLDEIALTMAKDAEISKFEQERTANYPWLDGVDFVPRASSKRAADSAASKSAAKAGKLDF